MTKAASAKSLSVMALSKQMAKLEQQAGQSLFERSGRTLKLTEFGHAFHDEAGKIVDAHQSMDNWLQQKQSLISGNLRVVVHSNEMATETIAPWLSDFFQAYPDLTLELDVKPTVLDINEDDYDVFWGVPEYLGDRFPNLKRRTIWQATGGIFASPSYLKTLSAPINLDNIESLNIVGYLHNQPSNVLVLHDQKLVYKLLKQKISTVAGHVELAIAGHGLIQAEPTLKSIQRAISEGTLVPVLPEYWWRQAEQYVYFHNVRHPQPKVKAFIDFFLKQRNNW